jgi:hypothetical protein
MSPRLLKLEIPDDWTLLEQYMWTTRFSPVYSLSGNWVHIEGQLKHDTAVTDATVLRRSFLYTFETIMTRLSESGIHHLEHPNLQIRGRTKAGVDGNDEFTEMTCEVAFQLFRRPS